MKNAIISIIFLSSFIFSIQSCQEDLNGIQPNTNGLPTFSEIDKIPIFSNGPIIQIINFGGNYGKHKKDNYGVMARFNKKNPVFFKIDNQSLTLEKNAMFSNQDDAYKSFFGKTIPINFGIDGFNEDISFYLPKELNLSFDMSDNITKNATVNWNADTLNQKGVHFKISCVPHENRHYIKSGSLNERIENYVSTEDDGSYQFKESDFANIPDGAMIRMRAIRANYEIFKKDDQEFTIYGISDVNGYLYLE